MSILPAKFYCFAHLLLLFTVHVYILLLFTVLIKSNKVKILERTYKKVMPALAGAKKVQFSSKDWQLIRINPSHEKIFRELGLLSSPCTATASAGVIL